MRILQVSARFSPCCCRGRSARRLLPASFGREVCSPRAPSLVPLSSLSSLPLLSLPKPICKQEFTSCLVQTLLHGYSAPGRGCVSGGSVQPGAAAPALAQHLAFPGHPIALARVAPRGVVPRPLQSYWVVPEHPQSWLGFWKGRGAGNLKEEQQQSRFGPRS